MERGSKEHEVIKYTIDEKKRTLFNLLTPFNCGNINVIIQDLDSICADRKQCKRDSKEHEVIKYTIHEYTRRRERFLTF